VADPTKAGELLKHYRSTVFPEDKFDDLKYYKMAKKTFEKMRSIDITAFPVQ